MRNAADCRAQAQKLRALAAEVGDPKMVANLLMIAEEYEAEAGRLEEEPPPEPPMPTPQ
jgi:hypothetical protein